MAQGRFTLTDLRERLLAATSHYRDGSPEGFILRAEEGAWLRARAKLVHPDFLQGIDTHWSNRRLRWNRIDPVADLGD